MSVPAAANPRQEAFDRLGGRHEVRVLEPSPPAVTVEPWFADDPVARDGVPPGRTLVTPVLGAGDLTWDELAVDDPSLAEWCAERWLSTDRPLPPLPDDLPATRRSLQSLAERVVSPARAAANGKIGLRYTRGGFGTPFFGDDVQVRVHGAELVVVQDGAERRTPITSLATAAEHVWPSADPASLALPTDLLTVDPAAAAFLGDWYGFAASVLEQLRFDAGPAAMPSRVQLWPEHFDMAVELGDEAAGARAAYGLSPGDDAHPEPYAYVAPWRPPAAGELWQATSFRGAELGYAEIARHTDARSFVLEFLRKRLNELVQSS